MGWEEGWTELWFILPKSAHRIKATTSTINSVIFCQIANCWMLSFVVPLGEYSAPSVSVVEKVNNQAKVVEVIIEIPASSVALQFGWGWYQSLSLCNRHPSYGRVKRGSGTIGWLVVGSAKAPATQQSTSQNCSLLVVPLFPYTRLLGAGLVGG